MENPMKLSLTRSFRKPNRLRVERICMAQPFQVAFMLYLGVCAASSQIQAQVWGSVPSPNLGDRQNVIRGIAPISSNDIWAVGEYNSGVVPTVTGRRTLIQHWDGSQWSVVPSSHLDPASFDGVFLEDVVALASDDVWAVGHADDYGSLNSATLVAHWDGALWSVVPGPNPGGDEFPDKLFAVAAIGPNRLYAVGETGYPTQSLILRWNGSEWVQVPNQCQGTLLGISAVSASEIFAVSATTVCRFDGASWSDFPSPPANYPFFNAFKDVAAIAPDDVWVVGSQAQEVFTGAGSYFVFRSYAQHWDGSAWTVVSNLPGSEISAAHAIASNHIWAVGTINPGTLILRWDGVRWRQTVAPNPSGTGHLRDVKAIATGLWAGGSFFGPQNVDQTFIARAPSPDKGHVVGNTGVAGAVVSWFGPVSGSSTANSFGNFTAADLPAGNYVFVAAAGGCSPRIAMASVPPNTIVRRDLQVVCN
jgi:hypothetical protein